ncbi:hypothetical protein COCSADRAFT_279378 [Bipolaris sorokiniana ND90Pr]|uniref:Uncharacterized protein n=1 Tax=Cochliobolus sativus (strain ND90Pr / ATCC 201652) TaxID=665912 RepID=M2SMT3_COCSN|nr:uncharacterized protein COCSADRAFT_279378 [Bipolaris sorokiniana ND90Pr]EMD58461.1 hypothetical protein COCSADRAFT_279378 [Bipolaris sorokiniana ND90Pr]
MCTVSAGQGRTKLPACITALPISLRNISIHSWHIITPASLELPYESRLLPSPYVFTMSTPGSTLPSSPITWQSHMSVSRLWLCFVFWQIYGPLFAISLTDLSSDIYSMYCLFCRLRFAYYHSDFLIYRFGQ